jgi:predicted O-methyltransferase YrrM
MTQEHSPIQDVRVNTVLESLHKKANRQLPGLIAHLAGQALRMVVTRKSSDADLSYYRDKFISIDHRQGTLIYLLCRSLKAKRVVEYGTSFGVSTLYLASAVRDNGGGTVIGTELEPSKVRAARQNFEAAGLSSFIDLREGDALETLKDCGGPVDFLLVDGWPKLARDVVKLMAPQLRSGAIVICDESGHTPADKAAYRSFVRDPANGLVSAHLPLFRGTEITVKA